MKRLSITFSIVLGWLVAIPVFAQAGDDEAAAMTAAIAAIQTKLPLGQTALVYNDRSADLSRKVAAKIGKKIEHESSKLSCQNDLKLNTKKCELKDVTSLVNLGSVRVVGDDATAYLYVETASGSPWQPVETNGYVVTLARLKGLWTVVNITLAIV